jgi:hypothetical protein
MNIDEEYAEKKKAKENALCQELIAQCKDKKLLFEKGSFLCLLLALLLSLRCRLRITETTICTTECRYSTDIIHF